MWQNFHAYGARCLIVVGAVDHHHDVRAYTDALSAASLTLVRLHAGPRQLAQRIMLRGQGHGPRIPGDRLDGLPAEALRQVASDAAANADQLARADLGDLCVDTDGRTVEEVAQLVRAKLGGWPGIL